MVPQISSSGLVVVAAIAFGVPLLLGLVPKLRLPAVVVEILAGILLGPSLLGLARIDLPIQVLSLVGLAFLLLLSLLFSREGGSQLLLIAGFALLAGLVTAVLLRLERQPVLSAIFLRLQDTTAQIRVRGSFPLLAASLGFIVVAAQIDVEIGALSSATGAALIAAGLLSVLIYLPLALALLRGARATAEQSGLHSQPVGCLPARSLQ